MPNQQKGFSSAFILIVTIIIVGAAGLYFLAGQKEKYEGNYKLNNKPSFGSIPSYEESSEKQNLRKLKEESKFKKDNEIQIECIFIDPHEGDNTFTLEVYSPDPRARPLNATILDSNEKILKELQLEGPYDSMTSPGDKVYSVTTKANRAYESKDIKLLIENSDKTTTSLTKSLGQCGQGIE